MIVFRVERIVFALVLIGLLLIRGQLSFAQCPQPELVRLDVVPLATLNLGDLIVAGEIQSNTIFATIFIGSDVERTVRIEGTVRVKLPTETGFEPVGSFTSDPFIVPMGGRNVLNTEFGIGSVELEALRCAKRFGRVG